MFALLKLPAYRKLWLAQVISELGDGISRLVVIYLIAQTTDNPILLSFVILLNVLPSILFGTFIGPIVDRFPKPLVMIASDIFRGVLVLGMIFAQGSLIGMYVLICLAAVGTVFFEPARTAVIPQVVGEENMTNAVGLSQSTMMAMKLIGPSLAGVLIPLGHFGWLFTFNAFTYVLSALFIWMLLKHIKKSDSPITKENKMPYWASLKEGIQVVVGNKALVALIILIIPVMLSAAMINATQSAMMLFTFKIPAEHYGFLTTMSALGSIVGALSAPKVLKKTSPHVMLLTALALFGIVCVMIFGVEMLFALIGVSILYVWIALVGFVAAFVNVPLGSLFVLLTPPDVRGRSSALLDSIVNLGTVVGLLVGGALATIISPVYTIVIAGILVVLVALVFPLLNYYKALQTGKASVQTEGAVPSSM
ncbi:MFS transporter [Paenibacillus sp. N1-5-1-14]|uniref:MFS transporter n=1 Tax=Paenibacillus radicibacter TaxID=2972488 RepID=UPI002158E018|nr:MFS transporter [Paenibacillus radicibacter]MCR8643930.1 MFS transporter [Paenibacillus radicibacter]